MCVSPLNVKRGFHSTARANQNDLFLSSMHSFSLQVYILKEEEGGRKKPFTNNFCPVMYTYTADTAVRVQLPEGKEFVLPGMVNKECMEGVGGSLFCYDRQG